VELCGSQVLTLPAAPQSGPQPGAVRLNEHLIVLSGL